MTFNISLFHLFFLISLLPVITFGIIFVINRYKTKSNYSSLTFKNNSSLAKVYIYVRQLTVKDYEVFNKYQIWKLYNQY